MKGLSFGTGEQNLKLETDVLANMVCLVEDNTHQDLYRLYHDPDEDDEDQS